MCVTKLMDPYQIAPPVNYCYLAFRTAKAMQVNHEQTLALITLHSTQLESFWITRCRFSAQTRGRSRGRVLEQDEEKR